jgi:hypothetical protein
MTRCAALLVTESGPFARLGWEELLILPSRRGESSRPGSVPIFVLREAHPQH